MILSLAIVGVWVEKGLKTDLNWPENDTNLDLVVADMTYQIRKPVNERLSF